jgi:hypothetical protein
MKRFAVYFGLLTLLIALAGCSPTREQGITQPVETATVSVPAPTSPPSPTSIPSMPSPTAIIPVETPTLAPTPTQIDPIGWNQHFPRFSVSGLFGQWAPTTDDFLYALAENGNIRELRIVKGPTFAQTAFKSDQMNNAFLWGPDSQWVYFSCSTPQLQICKINADGSQEAILPGDYKAENFLELNSWLDKNTLVFSGYTGGGHFNIGTYNTTTGEMSPGDAIIHGRVFPARGAYIPAISDSGETDFWLVVISKAFTRIDVPAKGFLSGNLRVLPAYNAIPIAQTVSRFED